MARGRFVAEERPSLFDLRTRPSSVSAPASAAQPVVHDRARLSFQRTDLPHLIRGFVVLITDQKSERPLLHFRL